MKIQCFTQKLKQSAPATRTLEFDQLCEHLKKAMERIGYTVQECTNISKSYDFETFDKLAGNYFSGFV